MRRANRNSVITIAAASGVMALAGPVSADSHADGSAAGSAGLVSGNGIQLPVQLPVQVCGNTVNVAGLLNPAAGNTCAHKGGGAKDRTPARDSSTSGSVKDSPGVLTGNLVQLPVKVPVNASGNSVNLVGVGNPVFGNGAENGPAEPVEPVRPEQPVEPVKQPPVKEPTTRVVPPAPVRPQEPTAPRPLPEPLPAEVPVRTTGELARTGVEEGSLGVAGLSLMSVLGGGALYAGMRGRTRRGAASPQQGA
ncbi:chaplin family protein [Streptomyces sp. NPDC086023]|uniref:chaplin n=1 Tax=Streptomyces sp. NPDC086023 TaxID=3365746 RepID=UPI0037D70230